MKQFRIVARWRNNGGAQPKYKIQRKAFWGLLWRDLEEAVSPEVSVTKWFDDQVEALNWLDERVRRNQYMYTVIAEVQY